MLSGLPSVFWFVVFSIVTALWNQELHDTHEDAFVAVARKLVPLRFVPGGESAFEALVGFEPWQLAAPIVVVLETTSMVFLAVFPSFTDYVDVKHLPFEHSEGYFVLPMMVLATLWCVYESRCVFWSGR